MKTNSLIIILILLLIAVFAIAAYATYSMTTDGGQCIYNTMEWCGNNDWICYRPLVSYIP